MARQYFWLLYLWISLMTHLIETGLSRVSMMLPGRVTSLRVNSATTSGNTIVHLHSTRSFLFHVDGSIFACSLCSLAYWIYFTHLDYGALRISLSMQWSMATACHTLIFQIWIGLRSIVLIILLWSRFWRFITRLIILVCHKRVHISTHWMPECFHMLLCAKVIFIVLNILLLILAWFWLGADMILANGEAHRIHII